MFLNLKNNLPKAINLLRERKGIPNCNFVDLPSASVRFRHVGYTVPSPLASKARYSTGTTSS